MMEIIENNNINCDECTNSYLLPPPIFEIPPPPLPPTLVKFIECNEYEFFNKINNNWDNDRCTSIPIFEEINLSSPINQYLTLVGVFACILLLVIAFCLIYLRRLFNQKNNGCKELKTLVKHSQSIFLNRNKFESENFYEECGERCNQYILHKDNNFINSSEGRDNNTSSVEADHNNYYQEMSSVNSIIAANNYVEPLRQHVVNHNEYLRRNKFENLQEINEKNYIQPLPDANNIQSRLHSTGSRYSSTHIMHRKFIVQTSLSTNQPYNLYSIPYEDFDELPGYSTADTGYSGSSEDGMNSNENNMGVNSRNNIISIREYSHQQDSEIINKSNFNQNYNHIFLNHNNSSHN